MYRDTGGRGPGFDFHRAMFTGAVRHAFVCGVGTERLAFPAPWPDEGCGVKMGPALLDIAGTAHRRCFELDAGLRSPCAPARTSTFRFDGWYPCTAAGSTSRAPGAERRPGPLFQDTRATSRSLGVPAAAAEAAGGYQVQRRG